MILTYFKIPSALKDVIEEMPVRNYGVDIITIADFLSRKGLHIRLFFNRDHLGPSSITYERLLADFIESGGEITWRSIEYPDIERAIIDKRVVTLLIPRDTALDKESKSLHQSLIDQKVPPLIISGDNPSSRGHYVLAHRINEAGIAYNDPSKEGVQRENSRRMMSLVREKGGLGLVAGPPRDLDQNFSRLTA